MKNDIYTLSTGKYFLELFLNLKNTFQIFSETSSLQMVQIGGMAFSPDSNFDISTSS